MSKYKSSYAKIKINQEGEKRATFGFKELVAKTPEEFIDLMNAKASVPLILTGGHRLYENVTKIFNFLRIDIDKNMKEYKRLIELLEPYEYFDLPSTSFDASDPLKDFKRHIIVVTKNISSKVGGYKDQMSDIMERLGLEFIKDTRTITVCTQNMNPYKDGKDVKGARALSYYHKGEALKLKKVDDSKYPSNETYLSSNVQVKDGKKLKKVPKPIIVEEKEKVTVMSRNSLINTEKGFVSLQTIKDAILSSKEKSPRISQLGCPYHNKKHGQGPHKTGYSVAGIHTDGQVYITCTGSCKDRKPVVVNKSIEGKRLTAERSKSTKGQRRATDEEARVIAKAEQLVKDAEDAHKKYNKKVSKFLRVKEMDYDINDEALAKKGKDKIITAISLIESDTDREVASSELAKLVEGLTKATIMKEVSGLIKKRIEKGKKMQDALDDLVDDVESARAILYEMQDALSDSKTSPLDVFVKSQLASCNGDVQRGKMREILRKEFNITPKTLNEYERAVKMEGIEVNQFFSGWAVYWDMDAGVFRGYKKGEPMIKYGKKAQFRQTLSSFSGEGDGGILSDLEATVPGVNFIYDPSERKHTSDSVINTYTGVDFGEGKDGMPPVVQKILDNLFRTDRGAQDDFVNWMAFIVQTGNRSNVAWGFNGIEGSGKGFIIDIFSLTLGRHNCALNTGDSSLQSDFNAWCKDKQLIQFNEVTNTHHGRTGVSGKVKALITDPILTLSVKNESEINVENHANVILNSNSDKPIEISVTDRRWNIIEAQVKLEPFEKRYNDDELSEIAMHLGRYLMGYDMDAMRAQTIRKNSVAKDAIVGRTNTKITVIIDKLVKWDYDGFMEAVAYDEIDERNKPEKKTLEWYFKKRRIPTILVQNFLEWNHVPGFQELDSNITSRGVKINDVVNRRLLKRRARDESGKRHVMWCPQSSAVEEFLDRTFH